jgi:hypothetical protein
MITVLRLREGNRARLAGSSQLTGWGVIPKRVVSVALLDGVVK